MVQLTSYKSIRGLNLNANSLAATPGKDVSGTVRTATVIADNCILTRQRMIGNRRGFAYFTSPTPSPVDAFAEYQSQIIEHEASGTLYHGDPTTGSRTAYTGSYAIPSPYRMDAGVGRGSLFFTSTNGVEKIDAVANNPSRAGMTKALDVRGVTTGTGGGFAGGFVKMGYHVTWTRTDANQQVVRSDVSTRCLVTNNTQFSLSSLTQSAGTATATTASAHGYTTGDTILISGASPSNYDGSFTITVTGASTFTYAVSGSPSSPATGTIIAAKNMNVSLTFTVPWDVGAADSYEVWRTITVTATNADPGDDCFLVSKVLNVTAAGGTVTFVDTTSDTILAAATPLYTNASQEGALQGNARPPVASAIANYKDYMIFANTALDYQLTENLLATINLVNGVSTFVILDNAGSRTYTAAASETVASQQFQLFTGGISVSSNIQQTTQSLCHVINGDSSGRWYAEYTSGVNDNPGIFRVWARNPTSGAFWLNCNNSTTAAQFSPAIPTSGSTVIAMNDARPNRLFYSKYLEPDHVPILNWIDAGQLSQPILRVLVSREAVYIIKADGVYYLSGLDAPFTLTELDATCKCVAAASAVQLNNQIFMLSNQGVVQLSLSGVTVISFDIEPAIMGSALPLSNLSTVAFAIAHEADRHYILYLPSVAGDTVAKHCYVYHTFDAEWVHWTKPARAGIVLSSNYALYLSSGLENAVLKQRRVGDQTDYADEQVSVTIVSQTAQVVTLTWPATLFTPTAGVILAQGSVFAKITKATLVSDTTWQFTIDRSAPFTAGAATAQIPIYAWVRLSPNTCGEVGLSKTIYEVSFFLDSDTVTQASIEVATNEAPVMNQYPITRSLGSGGWGSGEWGSSAWGDQPSPIKSTPWTMSLPIPDISGEAVTAGWIHNVAGEGFILAQCAVVFDGLAEYEVVD